MLDVDYDDQMGPVKASEFWGRLRRILRERSSTGWPCIKWDQIATILPQIYMREGMAPGRKTVWEACWSRVALDVTCAIDQVLFLAED
jgi:hypothetical protein